ncbi:MAG TPA: DUF4340 domain-containing protein [Polyangia bacterium]|nr:DUF4340 domain-containing protein [Polyangia bacterium]
MEKKTLIALIAFLAAGVGAFFVMRSPEKGQRTGAAPRPIPEIKSDTVDELDLTSEKQDHTVLVKKGGGWRLKTTDQGADPQAVKMLVDALGKLTFGDLVTESADKLADLGVADGKAARLVIHSGAITLADIYVGKQVGGFTMVRPAGKNEVWQASGLFPYMINRDTKGWRDKSIFDFPFADADKLTVEAGASKLALEKLPAEKDAKPGEPAKWKIAEASGDAPKTSEALDLAQVNGVVQSLSALKAGDFAEDKKPEETGLEHPWLTLTVTVKGKAHTLFVGDAKGDDVFVRSSDSPTAFSCKKFVLDRIQHKPIDYRDKTIAKVKADDLQWLDVTFGADAFSLEPAAGGKWKARGKVTVDENKARSIATSFENFAGAGFSDEKDAARLGLAKPTGTVVLHLKDKSAITIKIGALTKDSSDYYVQRVGSPDVLLVKKFMVERFLKKPADLAAAAPTAQAPKPAAKKK